jgi:hypothetical protein
LQNQEPNHPVRYAGLPPHLATDGPFLVPVTQSIWDSIKICRLCYEFYEPFGLFDDNAEIKRNTIIRPAETTKNFKMNRFVDDTGSTPGGTPAPKDKEVDDAKRGDILGGNGPSDALGHTASMGAFVSVVSRESDLDMLRQAGIDSGSAGEKDRFVHPGI